MIDSLHYAKPCIFSRSFSLPCAPLSLLGGPSKPGCNVKCFPVHNGWNSRDVSMAGVSEFYNIIDHLLCW